mgnify:CR=1 FL=1
MSVHNKKPNMVLTLTDLPHDILMYIFSMLGGSFAENPFLLWNLQKHKFVVNTRVVRMPPLWDPGLNRAQKNDIIYETYYTQSKFNEYKEQYMVMPYTISKLCLVSRDFNLAAQNLWRPFYEIHIRQSPYKRRYPSTFYRGKVYDMIKKYIQLVIKNAEKNKKYHGTWKMIKNNNTAIYLQVISDAVSSGKIDDENYIYRINDLITLDDSRMDVINCYGERVMRNVSIDLKFDRLVNHRRVSNNQYILFSQKEKRDAMNILALESRLQRLI